MLGQIDLDMGAHLPNFSREGASKTHLLRKDLRTLRKPCLFLIITKIWWEIKPSRIGLANTS